MKWNTLFKPLPILLVHVLLLGSVVTQAKGMVLPESCLDPATKPSSQCARSVTARFDSDGRLWITWFFGGRIYIQYSNDKAEVLSTPIPVNNIPENIDDSGEDRIKIAFGPHGQIYLAWTKNLTERYSGHIRFTRSLDGGRSFESPITVNDDSSVTAHRFAAMETNNKGDIYLAWLDKRDLNKAKALHQEYIGSAFYYAVSRDHGVTFFPNKKITDHSCECCRVAMAMDTDQRPVVLWRHVFDGSSRDHAISKFRDDDTPGPVIPISRDEWNIDACPHHGPGLDITPAGHYLAVWFTNGKKRSGLFYARSIDQENFSDPMPVGDPDTANNPYVLTVGDEIYIVWTALIDDRNQLYLKRTTDSGKTWGADKPVLHTRGASDLPFLLSRNDEVYVSWHTAKEGFRLIRVN